MNIWERSYYALNDTFIWILVTGSMKREDNKIRLYQLT